MSWKLDIEQKLEAFENRLSKLESDGKKDGKRVKETKKKDKKTKTKQTQEEA